MPLTLVHQPQKLFFIQSLESGIDLIKDDKHGILLLPLFAIILIISLAFSFAWFCTVTHYGSLHEKCPHRLVYVNIWFCWWCCLCWMHTHSIAVGSVLLVGWPWQFIISLHFCFVSTISVGWNLVNDPPAPTHFYYALLAIFNSPFVPWAKINSLFYKIIE